MTLGLKRKEGRRSVPRYRPREAVGKWERESEEREREREVKRERAPSSNVACAKFVG